MGPILFYSSADFPTVGQLSRRIGRRCDVILAAVHRLYAESQARSSDIGISCMLDVAVEDAPIGYGQTVGLTLSLPLHIDTDFAGQIVVAEPVAAKGIDASVFSEAILLVMGVIYADKVTVQPRSCIVPPVPIEKAGRLRQTACLQYCRYPINCTCSSRSFCRYCSLLQKLRVHRTGGRKCFQP